MRISILISQLALAGACALALDTSKLQPTGYVNDFAHALDAGSAARLEAYCGTVERLTGAQFAVVTVDTLEDEPVEDVANRLYRQWGIGQKGKNEGLLLLLAIRDHKNRVEVGYGLEPVIPDGFAGGVLRGIRPILRQGNYGGAVQAVMEQFGAKVAGEKGVDLGTGAPRPRTQSGPQNSIPWPLILFGLFLLFAILRSRGGGGGPTGFITGMLLGNLLGGGRRGSGWGGGGFGGYDGGGGGGGGGFGGFGGGSSGGGGASGSW